MFKHADIGQIFGFCVIQKGNIGRIGQLAAQVGKQAFGLSLGGLPVGARLVEFVIDFAIGDDLVKRRALTGQGFRGRGNAHQPHAVILELAQVFEGAPGADNERSHGDNENERRGEQLVADGQLHEAPESITRFDSGVTWLWLRNC